MTKRKKKAHKSVKTDYAKARPNKMDEDAHSSGNGVYERVMGLVKAGNNIVSGVLLLIGSVAGIYSYIVGHKMIAGCVISLVLAVILGMVLAAKWKQSAATCILAAILCFGVLTTASLAAGGHVRFQGKNADEPYQGESGNHELQDSNAEADVSLAAEAMHESVDSTESPQSASEVPFEAQIESRVWSELLNEMGRIGVTGTQENFECLCDAVLRIMNNYVPDFESRVWRSANYGKLAKNVDRVQQLDQGTVDWEARKEICFCRKENFRIEPAMNNAHAMGQSGLDCLFEIGKENVQRKVGEKSDIYTIENIVLYGGIAIDGFAGFWHLAKEKKEYGGDSYFLGEAFHHLGDARELTTEPFSICHLILAAVFYKQEVAEDDIYLKGLASDEQYKACKNIAIVFDKLDNKMEPEDPYFLQQADKYYTYALHNSNLTSRDREKLEQYSSTVEEKKRMRGIPLVPQIS